ncbi:NAD(P)/FAD-dependent oxidoreductase [Pseudoduganella namucuonensis]|uniref:NADH dehydrogenase n=1 Tax=Pseudoduganella namucuonensis TaxID=1035707 RepID=A0A1I7KNE8_9BURK|nr:FAD-dependent oxidoreductase [Pseudoduganella namucuonensis]SFU98973.1 NADH dehydrogenase [Pseudoduganella namucuonensis]
MSRKIVIVGGGFAGLWGALGAARLLDMEGRADGPVEIALVSPAPVLAMRPRLHESEPEGMTTPILPLLEAAGVRYIQGTVDRIHQRDQCVEATSADGGRLTLSYDRLLLTSGSRMHRPEVPGLREHAFSVDQLEEAVALDRHLKRLASLPETPARNTVVVVGGGFTGIEVACELPARLRAALGGDAAFDIVLVERGAEIGPDLGAGPRPVIEEALDKLGVTRVLGAAVVAVDTGGVRTADGRRVEAATVIWTGGPRASALTEQLAGERDALGRLRVEDDLRVAGVPGVFAAGDVASAVVDDQGKHALMSCQHALDMGRHAGHNVAADLLGLPTLAYRQPRYVTCLDLGGWGAVYTEGWDRQVKMAGADAKALKVKINTQWIYPPSADRATLLAAAAPARAVAG